MLESRMLCPRHQTEMVEATHWIKKDGHPFPKPVHVCTHDDCFYVHDSVNGYDQIAQTEPVGNSIWQVLSKRR
jgi:hypothetical protein